MTETNFDMLSVYYADDYKINNRITIKQPTIGQIKACGELSYFTMIQTLTSIPSDMKGWLDDMGIDYEAISDFQFFCLLLPSVDDKAIGLILQNVDIHCLKSGTIQRTGEEVLLDEKNNIILTESEYLRMADYIRIVHSIYAKREFGTNKYTKMDMIQESKELMLKRSKQKIINASVLLPLISTMVNSAGFKQNAQEILSLRIYEFMDSVKRIGVITAASALQIGCYGGNVDVSKIDKKDLDYMRDISKPEGKKLKSFNLG